ncbi:MAG: tellurite resistance TerB family protein, partial [Gammaproteobacteria bacterium]|nr:tellurite resistance TerB family protein [Gammaproteobacteria bacterium]
MDSRSIIDLLLKSGQDLVNQGRELAEEKMKVPEAGPERDAMLAGLGKGAAVGGVLALLLGTGTGRKLTGSALKLGSLAAVGGLAYQAYQQWQRGQTGSSGDPGVPVDQLSGPAAEQRGRTLLRAMIAAAGADGHIDDGERGRIEQQLQALALEGATLEFLTEELSKPLGVADIAAAADSPAAAREIYLTSL